MNHHRSTCSQQGPPGLENSVAGTQTGAHKILQIFKLCHCIWSSRVPTESVARSQEPTHLTVKPVVDEQTRSQVSTEGLW